MLGRTVELSNGVEIPAIGFGTSEFKENAGSIMYDAISVGFRHIDTASVYANEESVGRGIHVAMDHGIVDRKDLFITGKIANNDRKGYQSTIECYERSLNKLNLDYLDLYLIHWPIPWHMEHNYKELNVETWEAMEHLYRTGRVRAIGVSNFLPRHFDSMLIPGKSVLPMVNQIESHPMFQQNELVSYCQENGVLVCGWGPFRQGKVFNNQLLQKIAVKYEKTVSQIIIRWNLQRDIVPIPKSSKKYRMSDILDVFDFELSDEDMKLMQILDTDDQYFQNYSYARQMNY